MANRISGGFLHHHPITLLEVAENGPCERSPSDGIPIDIEIAFYFFQPFCKDSRRGRQNETGAIFDLLLGIEKENVLCTRPNINCQYLHLTTPGVRGFKGSRVQDRKSTRLNSSHGYISYAVFCLK